METINDTPFNFAPIAGMIPFPDHSLSLVVKGAFHLLQDRAAELLPEQLYPTGDKYYPGDEDMTGSLYYGSDFVHYKLGSDLMLVGRCHPPNGSPAARCLVTFKAGGVGKSLMVFGDRHWKGMPGFQNISEPAPFTAMPLRYENSFGGPGYDKNPVGKGFISKDGDGKHLLPNIEGPDSLLDSKNSRPDPEGFAPLHGMWQQRFSKMGSYGQEWLYNRWPWFPEDFDCAHCSQAVPDLQMDTYLRGDEPLYFKHLHPEHSEFRSSLPGLKVKCFVQHFKALDSEDSEKPFFKEIPMKLDTLWVDMDTQTLILAWRGWTTVLSQDYEDIDYLYIMSEPVDAKEKPLTHYQEKFFSALEKDRQKWGMVPAIPIEPELPESMDQIDQEEKTPPVQEPEPPGKPDKIVELLEAEKKIDLRKQLQAQSAALMGQMGINLDKLDPATRQKIESQQEDLMNRFVEKDPAKTQAMDSAELEKQKKQALDELGIDPDNLPEVTDKAKKEQIRMLKELGMDEKQVESLAGDSVLGEFMGIMAAVLPKIGMDPENMTSLIEQAKKIMGTPGKKEPLPEKPEELNKPEEPNKPDDSKSPEIEPGLSRQRVKDRAALKDSFAGEDFRGLDLSGLDLSELDFSNANLSGVKLVKTDFTQSNLTGADLSHADLTEAILEKTDLSAALGTLALFVDANFGGANLTRCNLAETDLTRSNLEKACLKDADCTRACLGDAVLSGADLRDAVFEKASMVNAVLKDAQAKDAWFIQADLTGADFSKSNLSSTDCSKALLGKADFTEAVLIEASFEGAQCAGANFYRADLTGFRGSDGCDFFGCCFSQITAHESVWRHAKLQETDFTFSDMEGANFRNAHLQRADFSAANMKFTRFIKANLSQAKLIRINLFQGSLEQADLTRADFRGANLYGVEFLDAKLSKTLLDHADLTMTKLAKESVL